MNMKDYPIKCLHSEVSNVLSTLKGVDLKNAIDNGFINNIFETDTKGKITEISRIFNNQVRLSMAFCQYLWIFCKIGILFSDNDIVNECINAMTEDERRKFYQELEFAKKNADSNTEGVVEALYADSVLNRENVLNISYELVNYANEIRTNGASDDLKDTLFKYIQDPIFSIGANGAYIYALAFILLHEYSHFELKHNQIEGPIEDELDADFSAFWNLYSEVKNEREERTVVIGMVCSLSAIAILQRTWQETEEHPSISERIEKLLNSVNDKPECLLKVKHIICYYIRIWAFVTDCVDCPDFIEGDLEKSFNEMFEYAKQH